MARNRPTAASTVAGVAPMRSIMAVIMVCGNIVQVPDSLFDPVRTLTANIALEMAYALGDHRASLFVSGLALMLIVAGMVTVAGFVNREASHGRP